MHRATIVTKVGETEYTDEIEIPDGLSIERTGSTDRNVVTSVNDLRGYFSDLASSESDDRVSDTGLALLEALKLRARSSRHITVTLPKKYGPAVFTKVIEWAFTNGKDGELGDSPSTYARKVFENKPLLRKIYGLE